MKSLPASNGSALPNGESDLEAIIERIAPERRVDFLRWRERVKRHGENDELLAVVGYLDTSVVLMDLLSREAQPEAIKRALAAVEKASKDQAAATARIPRLTLVLNTATLIITAVLGMADRRTHHGATPNAHRPGARENTRGSASPRPGYDRRFARL